MLPSVESLPRGQRLLPKLIDERADRDPNRVFASIPKSTDLTDGYQDVSYATVSRAIDRAAWWLYDATARAPAGSKFAWLGPMDLRYPIFLFAAMKCRYQILLTSPRNSDTQQNLLFRSANCARLFCAAALLPKMKATLKGTVEECIAAPELDQLLDQGQVLRFPYEVALEDVKNETCLILHTSGSTGPIKPIPFTIAAVLGSDMQAGVEDPDEKLWWKLFTGNRWFASLPAFHAAGLLTAVLLPVFMDYIPVFGPPGPPTAESAEAVLRTVKLDGGFYPPFVLEEMAQRPSAMEMIATLDGVVTGGAPLAEATGNRISEVTHLHCSFGHTEGSAPSQFLVDREDWAYFHFHPASGFKPEHLHGDLYKLVFHRAPEERNTQPLFHVFPDIDKFDTGDLISKHPSKPDLWLHRGRADDLVVLSTGEKFNPAPAEAKINTSTLVKRSLMAGNGRSHPLLLVQRNEATTANMTSEEITTALWPVVEETNLIMATQGRLLSDYVVILPENEEFSLSGKGSIQREASLTKFASYIESTSPPSMSQSSGVTIDTPEDAMKVVREILASVCGIHEAEDNDDLFGLGLDSAQAAQISGRLREAASLWPRELRMGIAEFYKEPTIRGLANRLLASAANGTSSKTIDDLMSDLVFKYTSGLEQQTRRPQRRAALTVALTGSTGNVGSHLLNRLVADPLVGKIICLNRAVTGEAAQRDAYVRHRLRQAPAGKKTVQYLCVDLAKPRLGLGSVEYETLQKGVDLVLHNAWELNFMRPVESFEKTHIAGVRHLIDLCTGSQHDARMVFISSIGAVNGRLHGETMITEEAPGPDHRPSDYGYSQAKSVSERILIEACNRGAVTGGIVRLGQIAGASGDGEGYWSTTDWLPRVLYTSKALGLLPRSLGSADVVDWVPVNAVPDILMEIVHTSADSSTNSDCQVHHIANPQRLSWEDLAPSVCQHLGEDIHLVEFQEWLNQLAKAAYEGKTDREKLPAMALLGWLEKGSDPELTSRHLSVKKTELVSPTLAGLEAVTSDMMQRWIREWEI